jgi:hypothetical protein
LLCFPLVQKAIIESLDAPLYDYKNNRIGNIVYNDFLSWREGKLYVFEECTMFFDGADFGSSVHFSYSHLSQTGSSFYPAYATFHFTMGYGTGIYYGKNFDIKLTTGAHTRNVTFTSISSSEENLSQGEIASIVLGTLILASMLSGLVAYFVVGRSATKSMSSQHSSNL